MTAEGGESVGHTGESPLGSVRWLLGEWTSRGDNRITMESWTEVSAGTFEGEVVSRARDTGEVTPVETLRLVAMSDGVFYMAKVPEHVLPIAFRMTHCGEQTVVFENPDHDFPKAIAYDRDAEDVLTARVTDGTDRGFTVRYTRGNLLDAD